MARDDLRDELEALRSDLPRLERLAASRAEAVMAADAAGAREAEVAELRQRHATAVGLLQRQRADIAALERELAERDGADVDAVEWALRILRRHRQQFLAELDETEGVLLARLVAGRRGRELQHAG